MKQFCCNQKDRGEKKYGQVVRKMTVRRLAHYFNGNRWLRF